MRKKIAGNEFATGFALLEQQVEAIYYQGQLVHAAGPHVQLVSAHQSLWV